MSEKRFLNTEKNVYHDIESKIIAQKHNPNGNHRTDLVYDISSIVTAKYYVPPTMWEMKKEFKYGTIYTIDVVEEENWAGFPIWAVYEGYPTTTGKPDLLGRTHFFSKIKKIAYERGDKVYETLKKHTAIEMKK